MKSKKVDLKNRNKDIKKAVKSGLTVPTVAKKYKLSTSMVYRIVK